MAGQHLFYYIGEDEAYFKTLQAEFKKVVRMPIQFKRLFETTEEKIQGLFVTISQDLPDCVFIDVSKHSQDYLHLARLLTRTPFPKTILTVGLLDLLTPPDVLSESLVTGMCLIHYKSPEVFDVVHDVIRYVAPEQIGDHGFATASLSENWEGGILCKIGYVHPEGLHFETDFPLKDGDVVKLNHCWQQKKIIPSQMITIKKVSPNNLFYQFKYAVDAEFSFIDPIIPESVPPEELEDRESDRLKLIRKSKKSFNSWVDDNLSTSQEKIAKVLIVDKDFHFYKDQKRTDKYPYVIRCLSSIELEDIGRQLDRVCPQVISVALEEEEAPESKNTFAFLARLLEVIKARPKDQWPFLVIFNTEIPSKGLQKQLNYEQLMSASNEMSVDVLLRMAMVFEKKLLEKRQQSTSKEEKRVYIKKTNSASVADFLIPITVVKLSETDLIFQTPIVLPPGTNLRVSAPIPFVINAQPVKTQGKVPEYNGLIHCLGEVQKKELRRFVNSVFFRDHDAQVMSETEEFKKLNEAKLQEKLEAQKQEEEASKASEADPDQKE